MDNEDASNGTRNLPNGSSSTTPHKFSTTNGFSNSANGAPHTNGSKPATAKSKSPTYYGHDREEMTRLMIQSLVDMGYNDTANKLVQESSCELESPSVAAFRHAVLAGDWHDAESLLFGSNHIDDGGGVKLGYSNGDSAHHEGLLLAEDADSDELRFRLRKQKYLELLEERDLGGALLVLRQELTPLKRDIAQLHDLSRYDSVSISC